MTESRVDAVLEAIGDLVRDGRSAYEIAQAAIEANDAWLKAQGEESMDEWVCSCGASGLRPSVQNWAICSSCGGQMRRGAWRHNVALPRF